VGRRQPKHRPAGARSRGLPSGGRAARVGG
jgi:hypothetical protein